MAIPDLLWACPDCARDRGLRPTGRHTFTCDGCGTAFQRDRAARIRATRPDGPTEVADAAAWVDRLPHVGTLLDAAGPGQGTVRAARVRARPATKTDVVHGESGYLNRIEIFDRDRDGRLELTPDRLIFRPDAPERPSEAPTGVETGEWGLGSLTAVQASSRTLQIKVRERPLVSFRFQDDSVFLWELLLQEALRRFYREAGRGEIVEFQPRIVTETGS